MQHPASKLLSVEDGPGSGFRRLPMRASMPPRQDNNWRLDARRLISLAVVLGMLCAVVPVPVSSTVPEGKDGTRPFPCQQRACGCRSADQCWKQCCCFTNSEKVAWAEAHGVTPPEEVRVAAEKEQGEHAGKFADRGGASGCCAGSGGSCHQAPVKSVAVSVMSRAVRRLVGPPGSGRSAVVLISAHACQGQTWQWLATFWSVDPTAFRVDRVVVPGIFWVALELQHPGQGSREPPVPPPR